MTEPESDRQKFERVVSDGLVNIARALHHLQTEISHLKGSHMAISAVVQAHLDQARQLSTVSHAVLAGMTALKAQLEEMNAKIAAAAPSLSDEDAAALAESTKDMGDAIDVLTSAIPQNIAGSVVTDGAKPVEAAPGTVLAEGQAKQAAPVAGADPIPPLAGQTGTQAAASPEATSAAVLGGAAGPQAGTDAPQTDAPAQAAPKPVAPIAPVSKADQDAAFAETQKSS